MDHDETSPLICVLSNSGKTEDISKQLSSYGSNTKDTKSFDGVEDCSMNLGTAEHHSETDDLSFPLTMSNFQRQSNDRPVDDEAPSSEASSSNTSHCHANHVGDEVNHKARRTLILASCLCLAFTLAEVVGGYIAGSLAIMTDAAHLLTDFASFLISLFSLYVASRPATRRMSFGWHRAEVLGAFISVLLIWIITGVLVYMAIERIVNKTYDVKAIPMLITAAAGVFVNVILGMLLHQGGHHHGHGHGNSKSQATSSTAAAATKSTLDATTLTLTKSAKQNGPRRGRRRRRASSDDDVDDDSFLLDDDNVGDNVGGDVDSEKQVVDGNGASSDAPRERRDEQNLNIRAAFIHVIGDFLQSIGVLLAAYVIYYHPELAVIDPICTFIFSALVLLTTLAIMRDALHVLMEGSPRGIDFLDVAETLSRIDGVIRVHNLRIWSLTMDKVALSVHLAVDGRSSDSQSVLKTATQTLRRQFGVYESTVQIEHYTDDMDLCAKCEYPKN